MTPKSSKSRWSGITKKFAEFCLNLEEHNFCLQKYVFEFSDLVKIEKKRIFLVKNVSIIKSVYELKHSLQTSGFFQIDLSKLPKNYKGN